MQTLVVTLNEVACSFNYLYLLKQIVAAITKVLQQAEHHINTSVIYIPATNST